MSTEKTDVVIIGGGYYGAFIANEVKEANQDLDVVVVEKKDAPFTQASSTNQGQFHMGYMYSGDRALASECVENIGNFSTTFGDAVDGEVHSLYGVHEDSEISAEDYAFFCEEVGLPLEEVEHPGGIFGDSVTTTFKSAEKTFNSAEIQRILIERMALNGVRLMTGFDAHAVQPTSSGIEVVNGERSVEAERVFNVTFADINDLHDRSGLPKIPLRYDTFLHFVLDLPEQYRNTAATVIRGPYASLLPSNFRHGHVLAAGRHRRVQSTTMNKPSELISKAEIEAVYRQAMDEVTGYMPVLGLARYLGHTIGTRVAYFDPGTDVYTSKAIVFENFGGVENYHTVLGGKVSCMFDISKEVKALVS